MRPDKVNATLAKRRDIDAQIVAAGLEKLAQQPRPVRHMEQDMSPVSNSHAHQTEESVEYGSPNTPVTERNYQAFHEARGDIYRNTRFFAENSFNVGVSPPDVPSRIWRNTDREHMARYSVPAYQVRDRYTMWPNAYSYNPQYQNTAYPIKQEPSEPLNDLLSFHPSFRRSDNLNRHYLMPEQGINRSESIPRIRHTNETFNPSIVPTYYDQEPEKVIRKRAMGIQTSVIRRCEEKSSQNPREDTKSSCYPNLTVIIPDSNPEQSSSAKATETDTSTQANDTNHQASDKNNENSASSSITTETFIADISSSATAGTSSMSESNELFMPYRSWSKNSEMKSLASKYSDCHPRSILYQLYNKSKTFEALENGTEIGKIEEIDDINAELDNQDIGQNGNENGDEHDSLKDSQCENLNGELKTGSESETDEELDQIPLSKDVVPLKKRPRMMEIPYSLGHVFNKTLSNVSFTFEEEFKVIDYIVRIEKYINMRFNFLFQNFPNYDKLTVGYITCTQMGMKIPFNKQLERHLFNLGLEFTKQNTKSIFEEMGLLSTNVRKEVLNSTYPALYVVFYSVLEGNTREKTWKKQHEKTLQITKENHARLNPQIKPLEHVRSISIKDQERFTSPWAVKFTDEEKFEKVISIVGRLLRDDKNLQALYNMLVMMTPSSSSSQETQNDLELLNIQVNLCQLIYRYLVKEASSDQLTSSKTNPDHEESPTSLMNLSEQFTDLNPDEKTRLLIGLIDDIHDCADIMQQRSLVF